MPIYGAWIKEGDFESWHDEWAKTAKRIHAVADANLAAGHRVSAREAYHRAANYYRAAEFYLHGDPTDCRIKQLCRASATCFRQVAQLQEPPIEIMEVPYDGTTLPAHFYRADASETLRPTLIFALGIRWHHRRAPRHGDGRNETEDQLPYVRGTGQGRVICEQGLPFRADWEHVVTPIVNHEQTLPCVDPAKIALMVLSLGGYLAPALRRSSPGWLPASLTVTCSIF
jgi:hypothetical protein